MFIDGIETSVGDFNAWLERNVGSLDLIPYMLIGERFANLVIDDKKSARKILEQITGEITIDMMRGDYSMIKKDLQKYPIEQLLERYKAQLKPLVQRISVIDALIETKENELSPFNEVDFDSLLLRIDEKTKELTKVDECIADASKLLEPLVCERERIIKEIHSKSVELGDARFKFEGAKNEELMALMSEIQDVDRQNQDIKKVNKKREEDYEIALATISTKKNHLEDLNNQRDLLVKRRNEVKGRVFNGEKCPYCGNLLSEYDLDKERKAFNDNKESVLNGIVT